MEKSLISNVRTQFGTAKTTATTHQAQPTTYVYDEDTLANSSILYMLSMMISTFFSKSLAR
jgi:hypothetical protein